MIRFLVITIIAVWALAASPVRAVKPYIPRSGDPVTERWRWHVYPELKGKGLRCLAEARDGAMWFGTNYGAWRYDGLEWVEYTPADGLYSAPVNSLHATRDGSVYAGTDMGISRYRDGAWERVFPREGDLPWAVNGFTEAPDGTLWAATAWGALHFDGDAVTCYTSEDVGRALAQLAPDLDCALVPDEVLAPHPWDEGLGIRVTKGTYTGISRGEAPMVIWGLAPDGPAAAAGLRVGDRILTLDDRLPNNPFYSLSGVSGVEVVVRAQRPGDPEPMVMTIERRPLAGTVNDFGVSAVMVDRDGDVWFAMSWRGEVVRWSPAAATWRVFGAADGLMPSSWSAELAQTPDGSVWKISEDAAPPYQWDGERWRAHDLDAINGTQLNNSIIVTADSTLWIGSHGGLLSRWKDGAWTINKSWDIPSMPQVRLVDTELASDGAIWFAGLGQEAVRLEYDTGRWTTYLDLMLLAESPDGQLWLRSDDYRLIHFDEGQWREYEAADGLMDKPQSVLITRDGQVWVAGSHADNAAISRFRPDGADGPLWSLEQYPWLAKSISPLCMLEDAEGDLWFGSRNIGLKHQGGLLRFDGSEWRHYNSTETLLAPYAIDQTADGAIWIGGGLRRFEDGVWGPVDGPFELNGWIHDIRATDHQGLWIGTRTYGLFRYDGGQWANYGVAHGLADNYVESIIEAEDGSIWVGTRKGISRFDGHTWIEHALPPVVRAAGGEGLKRDRDGGLWIWWPKTSIRYQPDTRPPETAISFFFDEVSQQGNNTITWEGNDLWGLTPTEKLLFSWRLDGGAWSPYSYDRSQILSGLAAGEHVFEVKARDQDFNEDPTPAVARFRVSPPVWRQSWFMGLMGTLGMVIVASAAYGLRKRRDLRRAELALMRELEGELQTARDLQMDLMPTRAPNIEGLDIAGSCLPASQVGGDFFQYYHQNGTLRLCVADVAGHAMGAAIPVVMFSGVLESEIKNGKRLEDLYADLNKTLCKTLDRHTFVCFAMGELELASGRLRVANSGCPYPMLYRAAKSEVVDLELDAYPLGLQPGLAYRVLETQLAAGDYLVFCSDGIVETLDPADQFFGFDRVQALVREAGAAGASAGEMRDRLLGAVRSFARGAGQEDDITCMVLRVTR